MSNQLQTPRAKVLLLLVAVTGTSLAYRIYQGTMNTKTSPIVQSVALTSVEQLFVQANEQYKNKQFQEAINSYHELLKQDPTHKQAHMSAALAAARIGNIDHAQHHAQQVIKLDEQYLAAYMLLGQCYQSKGDREKAEATYRVALSKDENFFEGHLFLAQLLAQTKPEEALKHAEKAIALQPQNALAQDAVKVAQATLKSTKSEIEGVA